ncbi:hypothetical protein [Sulfurimonas sp. CS5]|uniref:hypothetical protein n=1 Tax=Sulfurimonas sp. CS5 TaxID=3391145 RepID=UPI0039E9CFC6
MIGLFKNEFWYDSYFYLNQSFSDAIIYLCIIFSLVGIILYSIRNFNKNESNVKVTFQEIEVIKILLYSYLIINFVVVLSGGFTVGYTVPTLFQPFVRMSQFLFPLSFLIFAPFFTTKEKYIFIILMVSTSLMSGSKAVIYSLFISLLISKLLFNDNRGKNIFFLGALGLATGPIMFLLVNYIRYPELFHNISFAQYLISSIDTILYIFSEVSHRFGGYFDTLLAFITNSSSYHFDINLKEYIYEIGGALNRMVPGDLFDLNNLYIPFEEKSAYELRGQTISHEQGIGRHTESLGFVRFYFLSYLGAGLFVVILAILYHMSQSEKLLIKLFPYYFTLDMLSGGDVQSLIVYPLNLLILLLIFKVFKIMLYNMRQIIKIKYAH